MWLKQIFISLLFSLFLISSMSGRVFAAPVDARSESITRHFPVKVSDGQTVEATLRLPKDLKTSQRLPVLMVFGGFESAAHVLELIHTDRPVALVSFDYPFSASRRFQLSEWKQIIGEGKELFPKTVTGIGNLVTQLKKIPEIDSEQIIAIGASFGSPFVLAAAARNSEISHVVLVHGFGKSADTAEHVILRSWLPKYGWIARPSAWLISRMAWLGLGIETPEEDARKLRSMQSVLLITAQDDSFIPRESSDSLWNALEKSKATKTRMIMPGDHLTPGADVLINQIVRQVEKWLAKEQS